MFKQKPTERKKYNVFIWVLLAVFALCAGAGGFLSVCGDKISAEAAGSAVSLTPDAASLFLPDSYEQYLSLNSPVDIAVSERYVAIAEKDVLYLFDRKEETPTYHTYRHSDSHDSAKISKIQFSDDEKLWFSDTALGFYQLDLTNLDALTPTTEQSLASLTTFYINGDTLFEVTVVDTGTNYFSASLSNLSVRTSFSSNDNKNTPQLGFSDGKLYSVVGPLVTVYSRSTAGGQFTATGNFNLQPGLSGLKSATVIDNTLYFSVNGFSSDIQNGLYRMDLASEELSLLLPGNGFGALTSYGGKLYAVKGNAVMEYSLEGGVQKTDYEISSASDSVGRLSGATDSVRAGNLLVTADAGNHRLSIYDFAKRRSSVLPVTYIPKFVATDGEIIAAAAEATVYIYERDREGNFVLSYSTVVSNTVSGIACLYGKCYFITYGFGYGIAERDFAISDLCTRDNTETIPLAPAALTSDLYGNLYVVRSDGSVVRFTEADFTDSAAQGETLACKLPEEFSCVRSDFEGNLYCLNKEKVLCKFTQDASEGEELASIDGTDFVYSEEETILPVSYALGFEDDCIYFNFGNFAAVSKEGSLGFPSHGRLSDAQDIVRAGDLLVTADTGNSRITIYNIKKRSFSVIRTDFSPTLVATDGSVIAAANGNKVYVCEDPSKNQTFGEPVIADLGTIKGLACVHGSVYYITEYGYGKVEEEDFGLVSRLEDPLVALTADANGILYVVDTSGHVRYFYEDEFINPAVMSGADAGFTLRIPLSSLRADCKGDLYYIHENEIWKNETPFFKIDDKFFSYDDENELISFALGFEDDEVFMLYGNHIIKTAPGALNIPTQALPTQVRINTIVSHVEILLPRDKGRRYYL